MSSNKKLTTTDLTLLAGLSACATNKQLARALNKSEFTVRNQLSVLYQKINVTNRMHAAFWYKENATQQLGEWRHSTHVPLIERRTASIMSALDQ